MAAVELDGSMEVQARRAHQQKPSFQGSGSDRSNAYLGCSDQYRCLFGLEGRLDRRKEAAGEEGIEKSCNRVSRVYYANCRNSKSSIDLLPHLIITIIPTRERSQGKL